MPLDALLGTILGVLALALVLLLLQLRKLRAKHHALSQVHSKLSQRFRGVTDAEAEGQRILNEVEVETQKARGHMEAERQQTLRELETRRREAEAERQRILQEVDAERQRVLGGLEAEKARLQTSIVQIRSDQERAGQEFHAAKQRNEADLQKLVSEITRLRADLSTLDEEANLQTFGFYKPRYDFASSARYQARLEEVREQQKHLIKEKKAAVARTEWTVNGSVAEGRKQMNQTVKLILRAFNGECDAAIAKVKYNNIGVMQQRIRKAWEAINGLVQVQDCTITKTYLELKLDELDLVHEYQEKVQAEKEEQRLIREQMREEEIALREMEKARLDAEKEEKRYADALNKARDEAEKAVGDKQQKLLGKIEELQRMLAEAQNNKERAIARAQMTRSGHVYVISNVGSFGEHVYKIGMTRRLDPMERVRELGDASVPFQFDVHAVIFCEDAPALENTLHKTFHHRRVNRVNERKEFFHVSIDEIAQAVQKHHGEIEITRAAEAEEYRKTLAIVAESPSATTMPSLANALQGIHVAPRSAPEYANGG